MPWQTARSQAARGRRSESTASGASASCRRSNSSVCGKAVREASLMELLAGRGSGGAGGSGRTAFCSLVTQPADFREHLPHGDRLHAHVVAAGGEAIVEGID